MVNLSYYSHLGIMMVLILSHAIFKIGNGCGYNASTKDYPYLYFPGPDISNISSDPLEAFKYSVCVKSCPSGNSNTTVLCKEPSFF